MMKLDLIHAKPDSWVKLELGGTAAAQIPGVKNLNTGKYHHLDQNRVKGNRALGFDFEKLDPAGSAVLTQGITEVRQTGEGAYEGTVDVSKAAEAGSLDPAVITALGAQAQSVPFTAKVDTQGRLSEMVLKIPAAGQSAAQDLKITYTDYATRRRPRSPRPTSRRGPRRAVQPVQLRSAVGFGDRAESHRHSSARWRAASMRARAPSSQRWHTPASCSPRSQRASDSSSEVPPASSFSTTEASSARACS